MTDRILAVGRALAADRGSTTDRLLGWWIRGATVLAGGAILLVAVFVALESLPALAAAGPSAFVSAVWEPTAGRFGLLPMVVGTLAVSAGAIVLAAPVGLASALFTRHYAPGPLAGIHRRVVELLAGVPSVVYGFWGLAVLVPWIARLEPPGSSVLAGVLVLTLMILPTVALTADAALEGVGSEPVYASAALGLTRWTTVRRVLLPTARGGIGTGIVLAMARALGETMAVLMVCGNVVQVPSGVFEPVRTLTAHIALEMAFAMDAHRSALFVSGAVLLAMVATLVAGVGLMDGRRRRAVG